jgi:DNA-directed RNA polymerase specialized sigma24 family protein
MLPASAGANDTDDVRAAAAGDRHAFQRLYHLHVGRVHGAVYRLAGYDRARAEDLTQDAFIRAWQKLPGFRHESAFGTWL